MTQSKKNGDAEFRKKLVATFKVEAQEHLSTITSRLLDLQKAPAAEESRGLIETVLREAHSLKGAARAVNLSDVEKTCQLLESIFAAMKRGEMRPPPGLFDLGHEAVDLMGAMVAAPETLAKDVIADLLWRLGAASTGKADVASEPKPEPQAAGHPKTPVLDEKREQTEPRPVTSDVVTHGPAFPFSAAAAPIFDAVRIPTSKLDSLFRQAEELLSVRQSMRQHSLDLQKVESLLDAWRREWGKVIRQAPRFGRGALGSTENAGAEVAAPQLAVPLDRGDWNLDRIKALGASIEQLAKAARDDERSLGVMTDALLEEMKRALMFPFSALLEGFPKLVRDLARDGGKEIDLAIEGAEIEIDKRILDQMKDPFVHLVRNAADHGIEKPQDREGKGKSRRGTIRIAISQVDSSKVEVVVTDDGCGINLAKVKEAAVRQGVIPESKAGELDDNEALPLIFESGVSTSPFITDISGRGLGLAIVREAAQRIGAQLSVSSEHDAGTSFRIILPITLATFRGILVSVSDRLFVIPVASVSRAARIKRSEIKTVENRETLVHEGRAIPLVALDRALELPRKAGGDASPEYVQAIVVSVAERTVAFKVDEILDEQEVLVKGLGGQLGRVRNISGATVLGSGKVVPVLNAADLVASAAKVAMTAAPRGEEPEHAGAAQATILVVEDSVTSRILLASILESAGYRVKTAVDGVDGLTELKVGDYGLVVSDVDMPRMNGFELTAKIRADKKLADLPVVLVTALESRDDRERGVDAGANAYIIKSSFDQSNLLETVRRLL